MKLSHLLFKVNSLPKAVNQLRAAGFDVVYGSHPKKAYNAIIWFNQGAFIEIFEHKPLPKFIQLIMKLFGYKAILQRLQKWVSIGHGWCDWSIETEIPSLSHQQKLFRLHQVPFLMRKTNSRIDINGQQLKWSLIIPEAIDFPFLMSAYTPNPKPHQIVHPNQITQIETVIIGEDNLDLQLLDLLSVDLFQIKFQENCIGLQSVSFKDSDFKIEEILREC